MQTRAACESVPSAIRGLLLSHRGYCFIVACSLQLPGCKFNDGCLRPLDVFVWARALHAHCSCRHCLDFGAAACALPTRCWCVLSGCGRRRRFAVCDTESQGDCAPRSIFTTQLLRCWVPLVAQPTPLRVSPLLVGGGAFSLSPCGRCCLPRTPLGLCCFSLLLRLCGGAFPPPPPPVMCVFPHIA